MLPVTGEDGSVFEHGVGNEDTVGDLGEPLRIFFAQVGCNVYCGFCFFSAFVVCSWVSKGGAFCVALFRGLEHDTAQAFHVVKEVGRVVPFRSLGQFVYEPSRNQYDFIQLPFVQDPMDFVWVVSNEVQEFYCRFVSFEQVDEDIGIQCDFHPSSFSGVAFLLSILLSRSATEGSRRGA